MSLVTLISELWRFIKDHFLKIILGALLVAGLAMTGRQLLMNRLEHQDVSQLVNGQEVSQDEVEAASQFLQAVFASQPAGFSFVAYSEENSIFDNSFIFDEFFSSPAVVADLEAASGVPIQKAIDAEKIMGLTKTNEYRGVIAGVRDTSSNEIYIRVLVSADPKENLAVAQAIKNYIDQGRVPFMESLKVNYLNPVAIGEEINLEAYPIVPTEGTLIASMPSLAALPIWVYGVVGFVLGLFIATVVLFLAHLLGRKIVYAFDYSWDLDDSQFMLNQAKTSPAEIADLVTGPVNSQRLVLDQRTDSAYTGLTNQVDLDCLNEAVIIIQAGQTDKNWYQNQYKALQAYPLALRIVHLY
ncbi:hypothetical protein AWM75_05850 [Aerococcus urinaehominis]|uniref:Uncharacterized protein n=1 Tax=Aerococcus urinaehominis TaxID=128944 RepID=A0A109RH15_9LACT|nr:hypothetical protein [Aerococcus urinaehominis]AMB99549.1 hypothetical protein AWM75_05850 [Aerococcus urinaehominis]SDM34743.1 hypothetical protein SAMN04487985_11330 [Aerococcus urinaehominis]